LPEIKRLVDPIGNVETSLIVGTRALFATLAYTCSWFGALIQMKVGDYFVQGRRRWVRLHEKGGKEHDLPDDQQAQEKVWDSLRHDWERSPHNLCSLLTEKHVSASDRRARFVGVDAYVAYSDPD
jgi:integrase